ncbi:alpha/beta fold hydrolase [Halopseudomonas salegens]|nr:alpha/beta hydrolase [Halopseudomonas salegens]
MLRGIALSDWQARAKTFEYRGQTVCYWTAGQGEPLLLIHGFPTAAWDWHYLWDALAERYLVIACDMVGFGFSAKPQEYDYSLQDQADLQQALLAHLGVRRCHVLAHDYGDSVAQELLSRDLEGPQWLDSMCFLNGGLFPETHHPVLMQQMLLSPLGFFFGRLTSRPRLARSMRQVFGAETQPADVELEAFWQLIAHDNGPSVMHKLIRYIPERRVYRERWVSAMQQTEVPMRVIDGADDPVSGAHMVARYRELVPEADVVMLEDIGHYPQIEAPRQVLDAYLEFHDGLRASERSVAQAG